MTASDTTFARAEIADEIIAVIDKLSDLRNDHPNGIPEWHPLAGNRGLDRLVQAKGFHRTAGAVIALIEGEQQGRARGGRTRAATHTAPMPVGPSVQATLQAFGGDGSSSPFVGGVPGNSTTETST